MSPESALFLCAQVQEEVIVDFLKANPLDTPADCEVRLMISWADSIRKAPGPIFSYVFFVFSWSFYVFPPLANPLDTPADCEVRLIISWADSIREAPGLFFSLCCFFSGVSMYFCLLNPVGLLLQSMMWDRSHQMGLAGLKMYAVSELRLFLKMYSVSESHLFLNCTCF